MVIKGNSKMGPHVGIFNLPARRTCRPSEWCLKGRRGNPACYALRNNFMLLSVRRSADRRFDASRQASFASDMIDEIKGKWEYFRVHSSGDFYNSEYVQKWVEIVKACRGTLFRTSTRRVDLIDDLRVLHKLPNMIVRESLDPTIPKPRTRFPVAALSGVELTKAKMDRMLFCLNDCVGCDYGCWKEPLNIMFEPH